jgi:4-amino-4-deoxy-L-arabinose transferase-like glycosyltransferase
VTPSRAHLAIVALAAFVRAAFAAVFLRHPLSAVVPEDTEAYRTLARAILAGDWRHPALDDLSPLYGLLLAPFLGLSAPAERLAIVVLQIGLDAAAVALVAWMATRLVGPAAGRLAAAFYALYGIAIYYAAIELPVTASVVLLLLVVALALHTPARPARAGLATGLALGLLCLTRPNALVLLPVLVWHAARPNDARRWARPAWTIAGLLLVLLPFAVRARAAGGGLSPFPVNGGINFYIGNGPEANGMYVSVEGVSDRPLEQITTSIAEAARRAGHPLDARGASRFWRGEALSAMARDPRRAVGLLATKAAMFLRAEEIPLNTNYGFARGQLPVLRLAPGFGLLAPWAVAGLAALWRAGRARDDRDVLLVLGTVIAYGASVVAFFVSDRYRLPVVPLLLVLAAHGVVETARALRRTPRWAGILIAAGLAAVLAVNAPFARFTYPEYAKDYFQLGAVYRARGEVERAVALYRKAVGLSPDMAEPLVELAGAYYFAGRTLEAETTLQQALTVDPQSAVARRNLAVLYEQQGLFEQALAAADDEAQRGRIAAARDALRAREPDAGRFARKQYQLGLAAYGAGRLAEARYAFLRAAAADPSSHETHFALALVEKDLRRRPEWCAAITRALALAPHDAEYRQEHDAACGHLTRRE